MMRTPTIIACALLCLPAGPALAAEEPLAAGYAWLNAADNDGDGAIGEQEHSLFLRRQFDLVDQNNDGWIDAGERQAPAWSWGSDKSGQALHDWIADSDGKISKDTHYDTGMESFRRWDADGDGRLSVREIGTGLGYSVKF